MSASVADSVADKVVVITGASSGIGQSIADHFAAAGARVVTGSRSQPEKSTGTWLATDVADAAQANALIEAGVTMHGRVDVVINNAGVQVEKTIADTTDTEFDLLVDVNVRGVFNMCRAAVRQMQQQAAGGSIINIGSVAGNAADHGMAIYNATKGAVHALTRAVAIDHGADQIRCNAIAPGWIATALADAAFDLAEDPQAARHAAISRHPVGRLGQPEDVAQLALWLASDAAAFASGSVFTLDGGLTAQSPIAP